jgi:hypothetical protein
MERIGPVFPSAPRCAASGREYDPVKRDDRVEIPAHPQLPPFSNPARLYLGGVLGFFEESVFVLLDEPVVLTGRPERVVRVPLALPVPLGIRFVAGRGALEIDLRPRCGSGDCPRPPTTLLISGGEYTLCCEECAARAKMSAAFVSATPLAEIDEVAPAAGTAS